MKVLNIINIYVFAGTMVTYAVFLVFILKIYLRNLREKKERFYKSLLEGLKTGIINTLDDVLNIFLAIDKINTKNHRLGLNQLLREFIVKLLNSEFSENISEEDIRKWKDKITDLIAINQEVSPFSELPDAERTILSDVVAFLEKKDILSAKRKIFEISSLIQTRKEQFDKLEKNNRWSNRLAIVGILLTVVFGILSIR